MGRSIFFLTVSDTFIGSFSISTPEQYSRTQSTVTEAVNTTPTPSARKRAPASQKKSKAAMPEPPVSFELLVIATPAPKVTRTAGRKEKTVKGDPKKLGPITIPTTLSWDEFIIELVRLTKAKAFQNLAVPTFEWHHLKPSTSPRIPLTNANGWDSLLKQVALLTSPKNPPFLVLEMRSPVIPVTEESMVCLLYWFSFSVLTHTLQPWEAAGAVDEFQGDDDDPVDNGTYKKVFS